jgi:hypothetical protein
MRMEEEYDGEMEEEEEEEYDGEYEETYIGSALPTTSTLDDKDTYFTSLML